MIGYPWKKKKTHYIIYAIHKKKFIKRVLWEGDAKYANFQIQDTLKDFQEKYGKRWNVFLSSDDEITGYRY